LENGDNCEGQVVWKSTFVKSEEQERSSSSSSSSHVTVEEKEEEEKEEELEIGWNVGFPNL
jgi:hypothetical protein